jgi:hypothetical protein
VVAAAAIAATVVAGFNFNKCRLFIQKRLKNAPETAGGNSK